MYNEALSNLATACPVKNPIKRPIMSCHNVGEYLSKIVILWRLVEIQVSCILQICSKLLYTQSQITHTHNSRVCTIINNKNLCTHLSLPCLFDKFSGETDVRMHEISYQLNATNREIFAKVVQRVRGMPTCEVMKW